jgi:hypothetical protein
LRLLSAQQLVIRELHIEVTAFFCIVPVNATSQLISSAKQSLGKAAAGPGKYPTIVSPIVATARTVRMLISCLQKSTAAIMRHNTGGARRLLG